MAHGQSSLDFVSRPAIILKGSFVGFVLRKGGNDLNFGIELRIVLPLELIYFIVRFRPCFVKIFFIDDLCLCASVFANE